LGEFLRLDGHFRPRLPLFCTGVHPRWFCSSLCTLHTPMPLFCTFLLFPLPAGTSGVSMYCFGGLRELRVFLCTVLAACGNYRRRKSKPGPVYRISAVTGAREHGGLGRTGNPIKTGCVCACVCVGGCVLLPSAAARQRAPLAHRHSSKPHQPPTTPCRACIWPVQRGARLTFLSLCKLCPLRKSPRSQSNPTP
jgi:hypothetical protein